MTPVVGIVVTLPVRRCHRPESVKRTDVRLEAEPLEVLEERRFVFGATPAPIVILEPQKYASAQGPGDPPDTDGVGDVPQMQIARRAGSKARERSRRESSGEGAQVEGSHDRKIAALVVLRDPVARRTSCCVPPTSKSS